MDSERSTVLQSFAITDNHFDILKGSDVSDKVERLVRVLDFLLRAPGHTATLSEVASAVEQPLSSTHDLLRSMVASGLLEIGPTKRYHHGPVLMRLALAAIDSVDIVATARPHLDKLVKAVGHDAYLAIRAGDAVTYASRCASTYRAGLDIRLGEPVPLHSSAVGKLFAALQPDLEHQVLSRPLAALTPNTIVDPDRLVAELEQIRQRETAMSREETITGIVGFAAPVRDATDRVVAAVHVSAFKDNLARDDVPRIEAATVACAVDIQQALSSTTLTKVLT
jgi:IclR family acetate operon transcriptional repressor